MTSSVIAMARMPSLKASRRAEPPSAERSGNMDLTITSLPSSRLGQLYVFRRVTDEEARGSTARYE
jgi:hypothetical protein